VPSRIRSPVAHRSSFRRQLPLLFSVYLAQILLTSFFFSLPFSALTIYKALHHAIGSAKDRGRRQAGARHGAFPPCLFLLLRNRSPLARSLLLSTSSTMRAARQILLAQAQHRKAGRGRRGVIWPCNQPGRAVASACSPAVSLSLSAISCAAASPARPTTKRFCPSRRSSRRRRSSPPPARLRDRAGMLAVVPSSTQAFILLQLATSGRIARSEAIPRLRRGDAALRPGEQRQLPFADKRRRAATAPSFPSHRAGSAALAAAARLSRSGLLAWSRLRDGENKARRRELRPDSVDASRSTGRAKRLRGRGGSRSGIWRSSPRVELPRAAGARSAARCSSFFADRARQSVSFSLHLFWLPRLSASKLFVHRSFLFLSLLLSLRASPLPPDFSFYLHLLRRFEPGPRKVGGNPGGDRAWPFR